MTHQPLIQIVAAVGFCFALTGCGGHDFTGTFTGDVRRIEQSTGRSVTLAETWSIDAPSRTLHRARGAESCDLNLEGPDCSQGCYNKVVLPGQKCTIDGRELLLQQGVLESTSTDIPEDHIRIKMTWVSTAGGTAEISDEGLLQEE